MSDEMNWRRARLIPVSGIGSQKEAETRATSAFLAVLSIVRDLSLDLLSPLGASRAGKATVDAYTEVIFNHNGQKIRPDGLVRVSYGKSSWTALVEVKTGDSPLDADQLNTYWDIAREHKIDAVLSISNEIAPSPGTHPTEGLKVRSNSKVQVHHMSWTSILTSAVMAKVHRGVDDPEQAWILGELIRYLEHPASGAMSFDDMGGNWVAVRDGARENTLRRSDGAVIDIAQRWDQLLRYAALSLGSKIGDDVQHVLSRAHRDQKTRLGHLTDSLINDGALDGTLRVPHTAGDIHLAADLRARRLEARTTVGAPDDRGGLGRCGWLTKQLKDAPSDTVIEAYPKNARTPTAATLSAVADDRYLLLGEDKRDPAKFSITMARDMGMGRKTGNRSPAFIDSVLDLVGDFYGQIVQNVVPWTPPAPKIKEPARINEEPEREPPGVGSDGEFEPPGPSMGL